MYQKNKQPKHFSDTYPLLIELSPPKSTFKKSEYVTLNVKVSNISDFDVSYPFGADCPFGDPKIFVDKAIKPINGEFTACIDIGRPPLEPGGSFERKVELDFSYLESGPHFLNAEYIFEGPKGREVATSEMVSIDLEPTDFIYDCSLHSDYLSPLCGNIMITAEEHNAADANNKTCSLIRERLSRAAPKPNPIDHLSTTTCTTGESAVFVFNTDNKLFYDYEYMLNKLRKKDKAISRNLQYTPHRLQLTKDD